MRLCTKPSEPRSTTTRKPRYYGRVYGFGSVPAKWKWDNTPREVIGEGIVLRTGTNSSTILTTFSLREFYVGDYVEIE